MTADSPGAGEAVRGALSDALELARGQRRIRADNNDDGTVLVSGFVCRLNQTLADGQAREAQLARRRVLEGARAR